MSMKNAYRTIDDVLRKHQAIFARSSRTATTDRILRSTKLEDGIYADLRAGDESMDALEGEAAKLLDLVHEGLFAKAKKNLDDNTYAATSLEEAKRIQEEKGGFIKTMWCGEEACELKMKEVAGMSSRCIPFAQEKLGDVCPICGKPAKKMIYWGVAY